MTENMAARGEGLAGLVAALNGVINERDTELDMMHCSYSSGVGREAWHDGVREAWTRFALVKERARQAMLAALEAAAPAGTAHDVHWAIKAQCAHCVDSYPQRQAGDGYISNLGPVSDGEWFHHGMVYSSSGVVQCAAQYIHEALRRAALATPPPQAPQEQCKVFSTTSAREQSSATASDSPSAAAGSPKHREWLDVAMEQGCQCGYSDAWHCARKKGITTSLTCYCHCHKYTSVPAATQEPAGSVQVVTDLQVALRIVGDWKEDSRGLVHVHKDAIRKAIVAALRSAGNCGSPRKVGEDGDIELAQEILKPHWPSVRNIEENEARQKEVERIAKILQRREEVRTRTPDWQERPSSVPVGEQKQEDGV